MPRYLYIVPGDFVFVGDELRARMVEEPEAREVGETNRVMSEQWENLFKSARCAFPKVRACTPRVIY